jgi:hypothetical protein
MKSERRHDLKTNALSRQIDELPDFGRRYGNKLLLALIVVLLIVFRVRYRQQEAATARETASGQLALARRAIHELWYQPVAMMGNQEAIAQIRNAAATDADNALQITLRTADEPSVRADAYVAQGDLNWLLANLPALPAATTQPEKYALPKSTSEYLTRATSAYSQVLNEPLSRNHSAVTSARIGLAAIAENKSDWDAAGKYYNEVVNDTSTDPAMKEYGQNRLKLLETLQKPAYVVAAAPEHPPAIGPGSMIGPVNTPAPSILFGPNQPAGPVDQTPGISLGNPPSTPPTTNPTTLPGK